MGNFYGRISLWDCPHRRVVPFRDLNLLKNQARQTNHSFFIYWSSINFTPFSFIIVIYYFWRTHITVFFLLRKWFNHCLWLAANIFFLFYYIMPSCYNIFVTASFVVGTWPRSQQRGPSLCTSWLEVSFGPQCGRKHSSPEVQEVPPQHSNVMFSLRSRIILSTKIHKSIWKGKF